MKHQSDEQRITALESAFAKLVANPSNVANLKEFDAAFRAEVQALRKQYEELDAAFQQWKKSNSEAVENSTQRLNAIENSVQDAVSLSRNTADELATLKAEMFGPSEFITAAPIPDADEISNTTGGETAQ